jgi:hypothetical protein
MPFSCESGVDRKRSFESLALDELHHQGALLHSVDVRDVGMIERRQHLGFALEACQTVRVLGERFGQDLDGYFSVELGVLGPIHLAHTARADGREDLVGAELRSNSHAHGSLVEISLKQSLLWMKSYEWRELRRQTPRKPYKAW